MRIIVLGGAGDMGSRAVRDLAEQPEVQALIIGDYDEAKAQALAHGLNNPKVSALQVDANDHNSLVHVMRQCDAVASGVCSTPPWGASTIGGVLRVVEGRLALFHDSSHTVAYGEQRHTGILGGTFMAGGHSGLSAECR